VYLSLSGLRTYTTSWDTTTKRALWVLLPKRFTDHQKAHILSLLGESVQTTALFRQDVPAAKQAKELQRIADRARALLMALSALSSPASGALKAHAAFLVLGTDAPARLSPLAQRIVMQPELADSDSLPGHWWDTVQDIETATAFAQAQFVPEKGDKPSLTNARRLAYYAARDFYKVAGRLPPSNKGKSWFPDFVAEVGSFAGVRVGANLAEAVVIEMRNSGDFPNRAASPVTPARVAFFAMPKK
jgi:hypothetical protein